MAALVAIVAAACSEPSPVAMTPAARLDDAALHVCWDAIEGPRVMRAAERVQWIVTIRNCSDATWPDPQMGDPVQLNGERAVRLVHRWRDAGALAGARWSARSDLPWPLEPGRSVELPTMVTAPSRPGRYTLDLDLLQENVVWFGERTGNRPSIAVEVR